MRRQVPALVTGEYRPLHPRAVSYVAFLRETADQTVLVVLNYSNTRRTLRFDVPGKRTAHIRFSSQQDGGELGLDRIALGPYEVLIAELR